MNKKEYLYIYYYDGEIQLITTDFYEAFESAWEKLVSNPSDWNDFLEDYGCEDESEAYSYFCDDCGAPDFGIELHIYEREIGETEFRRIH